MKCRLRGYLKKPNPLLEDPQIRKTKVRLTIYEEEDMRKIRNILLNYPGCKYPVHDHQNYLEVDVTSCNIQLKLGPKIRADQDREDRFIECEVNCKKSTFASRYERNKGEKINLLQFHLTRLDYA